MANPRRALLGENFRKAAMQPERKGDEPNGEQANGQQAETPPEPNGELVDDLTDNQTGRGETGPAKPRATRQRRAPIDDGEKAKGRNLKIPDSVFRRLELEALRRGMDNSKLATKLLDSRLPKEIEMSFTISGKKAPAVDETTPGADD